MLLFVIESVLLILYYNGLSHYESFVTKFEKKHVFVYCADFESKTFPPQFWQLALRQNARISCLIFYVTKKVTRKLCFKISGSAEYKK